MILWRGRSQTAPSSTGGRQESGLSLAKYGRAGSRARSAAALCFVGRATERRVSTPFDVHSDACIGCGACAEVCPTGAIKIEDRGNERILHTRNCTLARSAAASLPRSRLRSSKRCCQR